MPAPPAVRLCPWAEGDLALLMRLLGDSETMQHLGGPDTAESISARHQRYLTSDGSHGGLFAIEADGERVGWVGYWETEWRGEAVWECGWHVLVSAQGRGIASKAARLMIADASARHAHRWLLAFPAVENAASNALCRRLGFELLGQVTVEYPAGRPMRAHEWRFDLHSDDGFGNLSQ